MQEYKETLFPKDATLTFCSAGFNKCEPNDKDGPFMRSYYMICFVDKGQGILSINEHVFHVHAHDLFLIPANNVSLCQADEMNPWQYGWISFLGTNAQRYFDELLNYTDGYVIHDIHSEIYLRQIRKIVNLKLSPAARCFAAHSFLYYILAQLYEELGLNAADQNETLLAHEIKQYIDLNYQRDIKIHSVAALYGIHPNYMSRLFRDTFGLTPKRYLIEARLQRGATLLLTTDLPISTIAISIGYPDQLSFTKGFHKSYHLSPSDYRKKAK